MLCYVMLCYVMFYVMLCYVRGVHNYVKIIQNDKLKLVQISPADSMGFTLDCSDKHLALTAKPKFTYYHLNAQH